MIQKFLTVLVILMMLVPSVIAAPVEKTNTKDLKINDQSKGQMKEVKDDKVKGLKSSSSDIVVDEKVKNHIKLKDKNPSKDKKEHKKVKVSIPATELKSIDVDNDGKFGILETANGVVINQYIATSAQLTDGIDMTFSEVLIDGFAGTYSVSGTSQSPYSSFALGDSFDAAKTSAILFNATVTESYDDPYTEIEALNPTLWYKMDEGSGTTLIDSSGNGYNATISGATWTTGKYNGGLNFDGVNDYVNASTPDPAKLTGDTTILMWYTTADKATVNRILSYNNVTTRGKNGYDVTTDLTTRTPSFLCSPRAIALSGNPTAADSLNFIAFTISSTEAKMYQNGTLVATDTSINADALPTSADIHLRIGNAANQITTSAPHKGKIDQVVYVHGILNETTISEIYYDELQQMTVKTNSNSTYSGYWNSSSDNSVTVPIGEDDADISSLSFGVPASIVHNGISIYGYSATAAPFTPSARIAYTEDTTVVAQTSTSNFYNVTTSHKAGIPVPNGSMTWFIAPLYTGTAVLDSNNTNTTIYQNRTHFVVYTGRLEVNDTFGYNVSVPNNADHGMWLDLLMQWVSGVGWNFVVAAPTDYTDDISDEITVTVS